LHPQGGFFFLTPKAQNRVELQFTRFSYDADSSASKLAAITGERAVGKINSERASITARRNDKALPVLKSTQDPSPAAL
jgi:hypothetical protein